MGLKGRGGKCRGRGWALMVSRDGGLRRDGGTMPGLGKRNQVDFEGPERNYVGSGLSVCKRCHLG